MVKRFVLASILIVVTFVAGYFIGQFKLIGVHAQSPQGSVILPKAWGNFKTVSAARLVWFEAADGTIRAYDATQKQLDLTIARQ